jgi:hypothetical protein
MDFLGFESRAGKRNEKQESFFGAGNVCGASVTR